MRRVQQRHVPADPEPVSGALVDEVTHLRNLTYNIWIKMKQTVSYSPLILDPNTADPELVVLDDLSGVRAGERRQLRRGPSSPAASWALKGSAPGLTAGAWTWDRTRTGSWACWVRTCR